MSIVYTLTTISSFLLLLFSLQLFFVQKGNRYLNFLLALFFFARFSENVLYSLILTGLLVHVPIFVKLFMPLSLSAPAFFYLYISGFITDRIAMYKKDLVHFIPALLAVVDIGVMLTGNSTAFSTVIQQVVQNKSFIYNLKVGLFSGFDLFLFRQGLYFFYFIMVGILVYRTLALQRWNWRPIQNRWLGFVFISIVLLQYSRFGVAFLTDKEQNTQSGLIIVIAVISILILVVVMLFLLYNPKLLYGFIFIRGGSFMSGLNVALQGSEIPAEKTSRRTDLFSPEQLSQYIDATLKFMDKEKPYLKPDFRILDIAEQLHLPVHHCSYIINYCFEKNFRDWINGYRINYFIQEFTNKSAKMTIEAESEEAGFSNVATFYNAFKKEKGTTPTLFFKVS